MPVEFRVLGPLEIRRNGTPVPLRARKPRTMLGALLVEHGRIVSIDRLIDALWPTAPPAGAQHALETHATRLRKLLGDDVTLTARDPGYVLEIDPQLLDSVRFEQLLAAARESEPERAATRADDALALWRGEALADFAFESFAQEEIARLNELRLDAEEVRVDAQLALGRASEIAGTLEAHVAADPGRERRWGQLMLARYRIGRQQAALDAFGLARRTLGEIGLEPTPALRELERAILNQDPSLDVGATQRVAAAAARRIVSVVAIVPEISLDLDPEAHERERVRIVEAVRRVAADHGALLPEPLLLAFVQEDHAQRAASAAAAVHGATGARVGVESGEAVLEGSAVGGPLAERARRSAREDGEPQPAPAVLERRSEGPFVGRDSELSRLRRARAALVVGPPGIGKSRLARELARGERAVIGRCSSYGSEALAPLREIAAALGSPAALDDTPAPELPLTFRRLCESAGALLVVFDDVHWADALVLETIEQLVAQGSDAVHVVCLAREELLEERPSFLAGAERIALAPLSDDDARMLVVELGAGDTSIAERAEGNPLFIEQLLAHEDEGGNGLPTSLRSLLAARLDRLTTGERAAVERAAVVGREFDAAVVAELLDARTAREPLAALVRRGLLDPAPPSEAFEERFRFRHALIQETTYTSTTEAERSRLHEAAADLLDARGVGDEIVGFHLERAAQLRPEADRHAERLAEDAGRRLGAAGIAAWKRQDAGGGARLLGRATDLLPRRDADRLQLLCELGVALNTVGEVDRATEAFREVEGLGDRRLQLRARMEQALIALIGESAEGAGRLLEVAEEARPVFEAVHDDRGAGRAWMMAGWVRGGAFGRHAEWEDAAQHGLEHYRRAGWPTSTLLGHMAAALYLGPTPVDVAIRRCEMLLEEGHGDLAAEASVSAYLGGLHGMAGRFGDAEALLRSARHTYTELGRGPSLLRTCGPVEARVAMLSGDLESAATIYLDTCTQLKAQGGAFHLATFAGELAIVLVELDRSSEAEEWCAEAERCARTDDVEAQASARVPRSRLLARQGRTGDAETVAREAAAIAEETDELNLRAAVRLALADVLDADGRSDEASVERALARSAYEAKGNVAAVRRLERGRTAAVSSPSAS
jgi:DNA-binding SARP family transcriptional activator